MSLFINFFWEKYYQELGAFILIKPNIFLSSPNVGVEHFEVDEKHVFAYFQYRSNIYMWRVHDLDLGNMINLSTRVNKTWQNSTQSKQLVWKVFNETNIWLWQEIQHHWGDKLLILNFCKKISKALCKKKQGFFHHTISHSSTT